MFVFIVESNDCVYVYDLDMRHIILKTPNIWEAEDICDERGYIIV